ncbi:DUF1761 domain-containing protein [Candidatus Saccharibacteria bacterium]|nr:DUF1761 domain-containing protein [Candidatus Saccharibacteria bacterium]
MDVEINYLAVLLASIVQFVIGAIWYMPIFGNLWGKIHGFEKLEKTVQKEMQNNMMPMLVVQFVLNFILATVLAHFIDQVDQSWYKIAIWVWSGFVVTTQASSVIFGATPKKWQLKKVLVMAGASLVEILAAAWIISLFLG